MMKIIGLVLVFLCGAAIGNAAAEVYRKRYLTVCSAAEMLVQMKLMMEYESPTLPQMIAALKSDSHLSESMHDTQKMPKFLSYVPETAEREEICTALAKNEDGFCNADLHKLKELFSRLGNSDRNCEQQRISAAAYYFEKRRETEQPLAEKRISLAKRLGVLGGIMAAVLMV